MGCRCALTVPLATQVLDGKRTWKFEAVSAAEMQEWLKVFKRNLDIVRKNSGNLKEGTEEELAEEASQSELHNQHVQKVAEVESEVAAGKQRFGSLLVTVPAGIAAGGLVQVVIIR
jgi:hypothetical protein